MSKRVFLFVEGYDYSAMIFEQEYNAQKVYEDMLAQGEGFVTLIGDINVKIMEFGEIDDNFITFLNNDMFDYDSLKAKNFYEVRSVVDEG
jgi:hypothetical protein